MIKFINDRTVKNEKEEKQYFLYNKMDVQLKESFKEYLEFLKKAPKEIIQLSRNANLIR